MKTKKIIVAGVLVREGIYSRAAGREAPKIRAAKRRASTEAQQRINARYSWEKLELMLAANFVPGDLVVTQTYDEENLPEDRAGAQAKLKKFRKKLKNRLKVLKKQNSLKKLIQKLRAMLLLIPK